MEWIKNNDAGGGASKLESWKPGQESVYVRFDNWKWGPLPKLKKVIVREVPSAGNRRALLGAAGGRARPGCGPRRAGVVIAYVSFLPAQD